MPTRLRSGSTSRWQQAPGTGSAEELGLCSSPGPIAGARPCRCQPSHCPRWPWSAGRGQGFSGHRQCRAAHLEGGAAPGNLGTGGPSAVEAGGRLDSLDPPSPWEREGVGRHLGSSVGGAITEPSLPLNPPMDSVSIPMRISRKSSVSLSPSPLPRCYRNWAFLLLHLARRRLARRGQPTSRSSVGVRHMGSLLSNTPALRGPQVLQPQSSPGRAGPYMS